MLDARRRGRRPPDRLELGVAHAGIYYKPGSLKARLCVEGPRGCTTSASEHGIAYERCGKVIVALDEGELGRLDELEHRGRANGVPGLRRIGADEIAELEPHAAGIDGLHSPQTGDRRLRGGRARARRECAPRRRSSPRAAGYRCVERATAARSATTAARTRARKAVVCAGGLVGRLAVAAGAPPDPRIVPFRGQYLRLRPHARDLVRRLIYPVPDPRPPVPGRSSDTRDICGDVLLGPSALLPVARACAGRAAGR